MIRSKLAAALAVTAFGVGAASAADLAPYAYTKAPPLPYAVYNWAGLYVGGHIGGSWTTQNWTNTANTTLFGDLSPGQGFRQRSTGVFGGGQIGYNWQASNYVFGLEGTISGMDNHATAPNTVFGAQDDVFSWRTNWMATITGRAGVAMNNNLFYAKGGYAGASSHMAVSDTVPPVFGSGWEYGVTQNWIVGLEYDYATFGTKSYQLAGTAPGSYRFDARPRDIQSVVGRVSYKFNGPLVARY
jgi:outer membrane immunogenic protein